MEKTEESQLYDVGTFQVRNFKVTYNVLFQYGRQKVLLQDKNFLQYSLWYPHFNKKKSTSS